MIAFLLSWIIISNICHLLLYWSKGGVSFKDSLLVWNILTFASLIWIIISKPSPETVKWLSSFIR